MIPACYFPTTIVVVDDKQLFLDALSLTLGHEFVLKLFKDSKQALKFINEQALTGNITDKWISHSVIDSKSNYGFTVNLNSLHQEIYNSNRFKFLSVVTVDFFMPGYDGIEFCQQLEKLPVKRIMLTGEAEFSTALKAFNQSIIDKFIFKSSSECIDELKQAITSLQRSLFEEQSQFLLTSIHQDSKNSVSCLEDAKFIEVFDQIVKDNNICEYYLLGLPVNYLLLDFEGKPSWLMVYNDKQMDEWYELAKQRNLPTQELDLIRNRKMIPCFTSYNNPAAQAQSWESFLRPAKLVQSKERYYYAFVDDLKHLEIQQGNVLSYENFLNNINT
jgi:CheY-like chemotaxis protein